jgi:hypothetical protein
MILTQPNCLLLQKNSGLKAVLLWVPSMRYGKCGETFLFAAPFTKVSKSGILRIGSNPSSFNGLQVNWSIRALRGSKWILGVDKSNPSQPSRIHKRNLRPPYIRNETSFEQRPCRRRRNFKDKFDKPRRPDVFVPRG